MEGRWGFGSSVDVDGHRIVAGAYWNGDGPGAAHVFVRHATMWVEEDMLNAGDGPTRDYFCWSVSISGDSALVGARRVGSAYLFERETSGVWSERAKVRASDAVGDFGYGVSIDGEITVVGGFGIPWA